VLQSTVAHNIAWGIRPTLFSQGFLTVNDDERVIINSHACIDVCESGDTHIDYKGTIALFITGFK
jgi:hypothetical protein